MTIINQKSISGITSITTAAAGDNLLTVHTNDGTERLRIDSSGNTRITAGIVTTLSATGDVDIADKIVHTGDTNTAIRFPAADTVTVETGGSERLRVDSSGNFGVGTNSPNAGLNVGLGGNTVPSAGASTGSALFGNATGGNAYGLVLGATSGGVGYISAQRADGTATTYNLVLQPNGSGVGINNDSPDGKLAILHTLDSAYGTTSRNNTFLQIRNDSTTSGCYAGIEIAAQGAGNDSITQLTTVDTGSGNTDFVIGLRSGSTFTEKARFQNGGGVSFNGDTAAANALDDYEEGTFTATCANSVTLHSDTNLLQYVKIGSLVTVMGQIRVNSSNSGSSLTINNLPFSVFSSGEASAYAVGAVRIYSADMASDHKYVICLADGGSTNLQFQGVRDNNTSQGLGASDNGYYMFSITYRTST